MMTRSTFKNSLLLLLLLLLSVPALRSQVEEGRRITEELCSEKYFGRGYIKGGDSLAALYLRDEFKKKGLKPLKGSFLQPFQFDVNTFPGAMSISVNGQELRTGIDYIVDENSGSSDGEWKFQYITGTDLLEVRTAREITSKVKSKEINAVVIDFDGLKGDSMKAIRKISHSLADICHVMVLTDEKFTFSVGNEPFPFSYVLVKKAAVGIPVSIRAVIQSELKKKHEANNVIAYIPGKKKKKYIVFTAHYDHLGGMGASTYFPGANDNASGTSMLFALADHYQKERPKYSIVFMAFAGEEAGLLGSHYFVEHPLLPLSKIKFLVNLDIMGSGEEGITVVNATLFPDQYNALSAINDREHYLSAVKKRGPAANSDHYFFTEAGVPCFFIYTMGPNKNYHDVFDTYENLSFSVYNQLVQLLVQFSGTF